MLVPYCSKRHYEALYASYLQSDPDELLDAAGIPTQAWRGLQVLDLCGGNGRLSIAARRRSAAVRMVDADPEMCDLFKLGAQEIDVRFNRVETALQERLWLSHPPLFDAIFCQQAVNYWLNSHTVADVRNNMRLGGVFVFNTFNTIPSTVPTFREKDIGSYSYKDKEYEAFYLVRDTVYHIQMKEGFSPHQTSFQWIPPDEFKRMLSFHFKVERRTIGHTDIYVCRTKET